MDNWKAKSLTDDTVYPKNFTISSKDVLKITLRFAEKEENKEEDNDIVLDVDGRPLKSYKFLP